MAGKEIPLSIHIRDVYRDGDERVAVAYMFGVPR